MTPQNPSSVTVDARGHILVEDGCGGTIVCCDLGETLDLESRGWPRLDRTTAGELAVALQGWADGSGQKVGT